jgi:hypothetical protein
MYVLVVYKDEVMNKIEYCNEDINILKIKIKALVDNYLFDLKLDNNKELYEIEEINKDFDYLINNRYMYNIGITNKTENQLIYLLSIVKIFC